MTANRPPTSTDLQIFAWMQQGNILTGVVALKRFKKTGFRDSIFRLRKAGFVIHSEMVRYKVKSKMKCYVKYSIPSQAKQTA